MQPMQSIDREGEEIERIYDEEKFNGGAGHVAHSLPEFWTFKVSD